MTIKAAIIGAAGVSCDRIQTPNTAAIQVLEHEVVQSGTFAVLMRNRPGAQA